MTVTNWINQTGNWATAADWSAGLPTASLDAFMGFSGVAYTLTLGFAAQAHSLEMNGGATSTFSETAAGSLAARAGLFANSGTAILDGSNAFGAAEIDGATVVVGNANALGFTDLTMKAGLLTNNASLALANNLLISQSPVIAAGHGTTFTVGGSEGWVIDNVAAVFLTFGRPASDGVVIWQSGPSAAYYHPTPSLPVHILVNEGTLQAGDANFTLLLDGATSGDTTVAAGATIDLAGHSTSVDALEGAGTVTSATTATLTLNGGTTFAGQITGALSLEVSVATLAGASTYTGQTTIDSGGELVLGAGGTTGSIAATSPIDDVGVAHLLIDHSNAVTIANPISGGGDVRQTGTGATILSHANTYSGDTVVDRGTLETANASGLGTGMLYVNGGRFLAGVNFVLPSALHVNGPATLAAATGHTLTTSASQPWVLGLASGYLTFGASAFAGTVVWNTPAGYLFGAGAFALDIAYGTLKAGDDSFYILTDHDVNHAVSATTIGSSGTLDAAGHPMAITNLRGSGVIANSGSATTLNFAGGSFSGEINGALTPYMSGVVSLTGGLGNFTAPLTIYSGSTLNLAGASAHNYILADNSGAATLLILAAGAGETGVLHGFIANDTLDLRGVAFATASKSFAFNASTNTGGKLTVTDGTHTEVVTLAGDYTGATFTLASDGHGGTDVTVAGAVAAVAGGGPAVGRAQRFAAAMASLGGRGEGLAGVSPIGPTQPLMLAAGHGAMA